MYELARYTDPNVQYEYYLAQAKQALTADLLNPRNAEDRGWCKQASQTDNVNAKLLSVDLANGTVASLITDRYFGCTDFKPLPMPDTDHEPGYHKLFQVLPENDFFNRDINLETEMLNAMPGGEALDPQSNLSPLNPDNPAYRYNCLSLRINPVPAHAAFKQDFSILNMMREPGIFKTQLMASNQEQHLKSKANNKNTEEADLALPMTLPRPDNKPHNKPRYREISLPSFKKNKAAG